MYSFFAFAFKVCKRCFYFFICQKTMHFCTFFPGLLLINLVRIESRHQRIWNQHKILRFWYPYWLFWVILVLFQNFECECENSVYFESFCKKERVIILPVSIILRLIPSQIHPKSIKLKLPKVDRVNGGMDKQSWVKNTIMAACIKESDHLQSM